MNKEYTSKELEEAIRAFKSSISKCEKVQIKLKDGSPQKKWVDRQLEAYYIAVSLIENTLEEKRYIAGQYAGPELKNAGDTTKMLISQCEKLLTKLEDGTSQKTLAVRRLKAYEIAGEMIKKELEVVYGKETS